MSVLRIRTLVSLSNELVVALVAKRPTPRDDGSEPAPADADESYWTERDRVIVAARTTPLADDEYTLVVGDLTVMETTREDTWEGVIAVTCYSAWIATPKPQ